MSERNDRDPAYPLPLNLGELYTKLAGGANGISVRDYFAAHALANINSTPKNAASIAYQVADAMLSEREDTNHD